MNPVDVHSASILIAVDQNANIELLDQILRDDGYSHIQTTKDPELLIELQRENRFDLIFLDLDFPDRDGIQMMKELKINSSDTYLPMIILTTHIEHKLHALQAGARDFISKPFDSIELLTRTRNILEECLLRIELEKTVKALGLEVQQCSKELKECETRFRGFTELASDWYWEQDMTGSFTKVSGPVPAILGIEVNTMAESTNTLLGSGWNALEQSILREKITARESFLDYEFTRTTPRGRKQTFLVSGQPMFDKACNFLGYRGIGVEIRVMKKH